MLYAIAMGQITMVNPERLPTETEHFSMERARAHKASPWRTTHPSTSQHPQHGSAVGLVYTQQRPPIIELMVLLRMQAVGTPILCGPPCCLSDHHPHHFYFYVADTDCVEIKLNELGDPLPPRST